MKEKNIRIIKKYPNRRLYDTSISSYITLQDIRQLVTECIEFKVIDAKTEQDLTHTTLLQIILEQEDSQSPIFTREILEHMIRFYGHSMQDMMTNYLDQSMNFFIEQTSQFKQGMDVFLGANPLNYMSEFAEKNMKLWKSLQNGFLKNTSSSSRSQQEDKDDEKNNKS